MKATRGFTALAALVLANALLTLSGMLKSPERVVGVGAASPHAPPRTQVNNYYDVTVSGAWNGNSPAVPGDTSDDSVAINATIAYASSQGGGIVYLPAGDYAIGDPSVPSGQILIPYDNIQLVGSGLSTRIILYNAIGTTGAPTPIPRAAVQVERSGAIPTNLANTIIRDLLVMTSEWYFGNTTNWRTPAHPGVVGLRLAGTQQALVENVFINGYDNGVLLVAGNSGILMNHVSGNVCRVGLHISSAENGTGANTHTPDPASWEWQTENRFDHCVFSGGVGGQYADVGVLLEGYAVGDQNFHDLHALWCSYGVQLVYSPRSGSNGYATNIVLEGFVSDWCSTLAMQAIGYSDVKVDMAFVGVRGFWFDQCSNCVVSNSEFHTPDAGQSAITLVDCNVMRMVGNGFNGFQSGINSAGLSFSTVTGCTFVGPSTPGNLVNLLASTSNNSQFNSLTGNSFQASGGGSIVEASTGADYNYVFANTYGNGVSQPQVYGAHSVRNPP